MFDIDSLNMTQPTIGHLPNEDLFGHWQFDDASLFGDKSDLYFFLTDEGENRYSGNVGCNSMVGGYEISGDSNELSVSGSASTRMYCEEKMEFERNLSEFLQGIESYYFTESGDLVIVSKVHGESKEFILHKKK